METLKKIDPKIVEANKGYYQIKKEEIYNGIQLCRENAIKLYDAALITAKELRTYGAANSLMILTVE